MPDSSIRPLPTNAGEKNGSAKLTAADVAEIQSLLAAGAVQRRLAERFGVSAATICNIAKGKNWIAVPPLPRRADAPPPRGSVRQSCETCGTEFAVKRSQVTRGEGRFCGRKCANVARRTPLAVRAWAFVQKGEPDDCWPWQGSKLPRGYGLIGIPGEGSRLAHRVIWDLSHPEDPADDRDVCHSCDNPSCCNPAHLWVGTHQENQQDMSAKGRTGAQRYPDFYGQSKEKRRGGKPSAL